MQQPVPVPAIELASLTKVYKKSARPALNKVSLSVGAGEVYGYLGPNGAGKSTTIRTLLNFIQPTSGRARILGLDAVKDSVAIKRTIGYLSGDVALYQKMSGGQFLSYMAELQPIRHPHYERELLTRFQADTRKNISELSKGNRQKLGIIQAFVHEPAVLILDEPTSGLDPLMQEVFFDTVQEAKARGAAVFISSHNLTEVQKTCDRIGFIKDGTLMREHSIHEVAAKTGTVFSITFAQQVPITELKRLPGTSVDSVSGKIAQVRITGSLTPLFGLLARREVVTLDRVDTSLEQEFLKFFEAK